MDIYLLLKTDISEGSDYRPSCIGAYGSDAVARNKALHVAEDYIGDLKADGKNAIFDEDELRVADESGIYGIQMNVVKLRLDSIQLTVADEEA